MKWYYKGTIGLIIVLAVVAGITLYPTDYRKMLDDYPNATYILLDFEENDRIEILTRGISDYLRWKYDVDKFVLYSGRYIGAEEDWLVYYQRTWLDLKKVSDLSICSRVTATRCYVDNYFERLQRKQTLIQLYFDPDTDRITVIKETPYYAYGYASGSGGTLIQKATITDRSAFYNFPENYEVIWEPASGREGSTHKLVWRIEHLEFIDKSPKGYFDDIQNAVFGKDIKVTWEDEDTFDFGYAFENESRMMVYFKPAVGTQDLTIRLFDPTVVLYLNGSSENRFYELGQPANLTATTTSGTVCIDIDAPGYGDNYVCDAGSVETTFNVFSGNHKLNDSSTEKNLTYGSLQNQTEWIRQNVQDNMEYCYWNLTGYDTGSGYPENVKIFINESFSNQMYGPLQLGTITSNELNDSSTAKNETYGNGIPGFGNPPVPIVDYLRLPADADVSTAYLNLTGFQGNLSLQNISAFKTQDMYLIFPDFVEDDNGLFHFCAEDWRYSTPNLVYNTYNKTTGVWGSWEIVANLENNALSAFCAIATDDNERPHIIARVGAGPNGAPAYHIDYWNKTGGSWYYEDNPSGDNDDIGIATVSYGNILAIKVDSNEDVHIFGNSLENELIKLERDSGIWSYTADFRTPSYASGQVELELTSAGRERVAYNEGMYKISLLVETSDDVYTDSVITVDEAVVADWDFKINSTNHLFFTFYNYTDQVPHVNIGTADATPTWSTRYILTERCYFPRTAVGDGSVHVFCENKTNDIFYHIWSTDMSTWYNKSWDFDDSVLAYINQEALMDKDGRPWFLEGSYAGTGQYDMYLWSLYYPRNVYFLVAGEQVWNASNQIFNWTVRTDNFESQLDSAISDCTPAASGYCDIPLYLSEDDPGAILQIDDIEINFTNEFNPFNLSISLIQTFLDNIGSGYTDVPFDIEADKGKVEISGINCSFLGTAKYNITAHSNSDFDHHNLSSIYSGLDLIFPPGLSWFEFLPTSNSSKNVTPYGQSYNIPIFNHSSLAYDKAMKISIFWNTTNETILDCANITLDFDNTKDGILITNESQTFIENLAVGGSNSTWAWLDMDNCPGRWIEVDLIWDTCCYECVPCW